MKIIIFILIANISVFSLACSNEKAVVVEKSSQKLSEDNIFKDYETALDKAKSVEKTIQDAADARKREMEERGY